MKHSSLKSRLETLEKQNSFRRPRTLQSRGHYVTTGSRELVNFSGNDYLGLAGNSAMQAEFFKAFATQNTRNWMASSSSRALTGTFPSHERLEKNIARSYNKDRALIFNSGYHANSGILPSITSSSDLIIADKFVHASLIDGVRLGKAAFKRFLHNDIEQLDRLLEKYQHEFTNIWIVTESLFSMDGDYAPLDALVRLKKKYNTYLYIDEAHAVGCLGENGLGLADELGLIQDVDVLVGTFGKALAGYGGFAVGDRVLIEAMENFARSWIFSTSLSPIMMDWNNFVWEEIANLSELRDQLNRSTKLFRAGLSEWSQDVRGESYIVPLITPGNKNVVELAARLEKTGILALPIRSPTVPAGQERIRFSLMADLPENQLSKCLAEIKQVR